MRSYKFDSVQGNSGKLRLFQVKYKYFVFSEKVPWVLVVKLKTIISLIESLSMKSSKNTRKIIIMLAGGLIFFNGSPLITIAEETISISLQFNPITPPDRGTPPTDSGTGSRGECLAKKGIPSLKRLTGSPALKFTLSAYPTIWLYVPYTTQDAPDGNFSLQLGDKEIYQTKIQLPKTPGIIGIPLPKNLPPLALEQDYRWYIDVNCSSAITTNTSASPASVTGLIRRIQPSEELKKELADTTTALEKIAVYARYGIWYETLTQLAQLRLKEPQNPQLQESWINLLSEPTVGLQDLAQEPLLGIF